MSDTDFTDFDLRKFSSLSPMDQLTRLERDIRVRDKREKDLRAAELELEAETKKEPIP